MTRLGSEASAGGATWSGRKVLVTGAGGFIGSHLAERLVREGAAVRAMVHYNALGARGWLDDSELADEMDILAGDIADADCVRDAVSGCEVVFHLAALIAIPYSYHAPRSYVRTNIEGTLNVLQAGRAAGVERIVHTSTSETYGTAQHVPIDEDHPLQGQSPYAASKIGADKMAEAFARSFGLPVVTARPFNTFGPRQSARAVIPAIITQLLAGPTVKLGATEPTRDFNYVDDTVAGYLALARCDAAIGRAVNLGRGQEISIGDLVGLIGRIVGREPDITTDADRVRPEASEVDRLLASNALVAELCGWRPAVSLREGLERTVEWIKEHRDRYRPGHHAL